MGMGGTSFGVRVKDTAMLNRFTSVFAAVRNTASQIHAGLGIVIDDPAISAPIRRPKIKRLGRFVQVWVISTYRRFTASSPVETPKAERTDSCPIIYVEEFKLGGHFQTRISS